MFAAVERAFFGNKSFYRQRSKRLSNFFSTDGKLCYCNDIPALFESIGINDDPDKRRLFLDGSKKSIKAVLLHNGNILPSVAVAYSTTLKETCCISQQSYLKFPYSVNKQVIILQSTRANIFMFIITVEFQSYRLGQVYITCTVYKKCTGCSQRKLFTRRVFSG